MSAKTSYPLFKRFLGKRIFLYFYDLIFISLSLYLSFWFRFEGNIPSNYLAVFFHTFLLICILRFIIYQIFGLYRPIWRYASIHELWTIFAAVTISSLTITASVFFLRILHYPRSVILLDWFFNLLFIGGVRFAPRLRKEFRKSRAFPNKRLLIMGAGDAGEMVLREIQKHPELGYRTVGFIDDDLKKVGRRIHNLKVLGTRKEIARILTVLKKSI